MIHYVTIIKIKFIVALNYGFFRVLGASETLHMRTFLSSVYCFQHFNPRIFFSKHHLSLWSIKGSYFLLSGFSNPDQQKAAQRGNITDMRMNHVYLKLL